MLFVKRGIDMKFNGEISFDGKNGLQWIKEDEETGLIEVCLNNDDGCDMILSFDPELLKSILETGKKFFETGKTSENINAGTCRVKPELHLWIDDEDVSINVHPGDLEEENPGLIIKGKRYGEVSLCFNFNQARMIAYCCQKIIELRESLKELQKAKFVSTKPEAV